MLSRKKRRCKMTKEQLSRANQLKAEEQLLDDLFYTTTCDRDYQRLAEMYREAICKAFTQIKETIHAEFEKL